MDIISAIILGVVQGITEFLPISSTGHLILARTLLDIHDQNALAFDAVLHLATASAVVVYFFGDIWNMLQALRRMLARMPVNPKDVQLIKALIIGTIPAVILGLLLEDIMNTAFRNPLLVAGVLVAGSLFFMYAEYNYGRRYRDGKIDAPTGFKIGLFQTLALIPGFSRSGAALAGGMLLGLTRTEAARFSFLLAIPIMLGAGSKKTLELMMSDTHTDWLPVLIGAAVSFAIGLAAIHFMISFVRKHTLWPFIWYRIILAGIVVFVFLFS